MGEIHRLNGGLPRRTYPWEELRQLYVEGRVDDKGERTYPSMREIAELFDVVEARIRERAAKEKWTDKRAAFQLKIETTRQKMRAQTVAKEAVAIDERALNISKIAVQLVQGRVTQIAQEMGKQAQAKKAYDDAKAAGVGEEELARMDYDPWAPAAVDARELHTLAQAAAAWHTLALKALGENPTQRVEVTGANGAPIEVEHTDIRQELVRDDPARLYGLLVAIQRAQFAAGVVPGDDGDGPGDDPGAAAVAAG